MEQEGHFFKPTGQPIFLTLFNNPFIIVLQQRNNFIFF